MKQPEKSIKFRFLKLYGNVFGQSQTQFNLEINLAPNINDFQNIPLFSCFPIVVLEHQILEHLNLNLPVPPLKVYPVFRFSFVFPVMLLELFESRENCHPVLWGERKTVEQIPSIVRCHD